MPNGDTRGPNLEGPRTVIVVLFVVAVAGLLYVLNRVTDGAVWPF